MIDTQALAEVIEVLPQIPLWHVPGSAMYNLLKGIIQKETAKKFGSEDKKLQTFEPYGQLCFPFFKMGAITSLNLFEIDELIIFSFYWINRLRYKKVLDIGANIGLHTIIMSKCGFEVFGYEPDPIHFKKLKENLILNGLSDVKIYNMAVSDKNDQMEFIQVLGNTTGSHLTGSKSNPYGVLNKIQVQVREFKDIISGIDLAKIDIEGHEKTIIKKTKADDWRTLDVLLSIHDAVNAKEIFKHLQHLQVNIFSQKIGWRLVQKVEEMPVSHCEGSVFVSVKKSMPWFCS
jgi:FkbM family methyltransferase